MKTKKIHILPSLIKEKNKDLPDSGHLTAALGFGSQPAALAHLDFCSPSDFEIHADLVSITAVDGFMVASRKGPPFPLKGCQASLEGACPISHSLLACFLGLHRRGLVGRRAQWQTRSVPR